MPVDFAQLDAMAGTVVDLYDEAELEVIRLITDRLSRDLNSEDWAIRRFADTQTLAREAMAVANRLDRDGPDEARRAVAEAYAAGENWAAGDLAGRTGRADPSQRDAAIRSLADALAGELRPLHSAILPQTQSAYRKAIAAATARTLAGIQDRRRAAQTAWSRIVDQGITGFVDTSGRLWRLHSYVEMATRTALARAATDALTATYEAAGQRLVYVTDSAGECDICRIFEHQVLALWGPTGVQAVPDVARDRVVEVDVLCTLDEARAAGLMHPNCRHSVRPWLPGLTRLSSYTEDPEGDAARQRQRAIERTLRRWREREAAAFEAAAVATARTHIAAWDAEMVRHLDATGLRRLRYREMPGAGHTA